MIFSKYFEMGLKDIDEDAKITNKAILRFLEDIAAYHADSINNGVLSRKETQTGWVILDWKVKVLDRPLYGQKLKVNTWVTEIGKCYTHRDFEICDEKGKVCIIATSKWVLVDVNTKKIIRIPEELVKRYSPEKNKKAFEEDLKKLRKDTDEYTSQINYVVCRRDIDVNEHMHNIYYLDFAYEALPQDVYKTQKFNNIRIMYKNEIKMAEKIKCKYKKEKEKHIIVILNEDETILHSIIELS